ncbi:hypothetical protein [Cytobacillus purgationiresistens]|uniref:YhjD n=1 Tax=Cytobacillus purgationiresistens TaxID=863449 RepID=A0ABU0AQC5_9BACI|nr:hypothetical protein [Cytobacillus purgationiresistens]MDQ0273481.1 hypothetical protein [Cytobacillus purgationiresistens]
MTKIPDTDRDLIEQAMYLPMLIIVLEKDKNIIEKSPFKLKGPYINLIEKTLQDVRKELRDVKNRMRSSNIKVQETKRDKDFTTFTFFYKGYEEDHNYFNPRLRNKVNELLEYYLYKRYNF